MLSARARSFSVDEGLIEIIEVEDRWYEPTAMFFRVRAARVGTTEDKRYILRYDERGDEWTLQSGFDGAELLARPNIELVTVGPRRFELRSCALPVASDTWPAEADHLFDSILAEVLEKRGPVEFVLTETARCSNCKSGIHEKTFVEPQGGVEVEAPVT